MTKAYRKPGSQMCSKCVHYSNSKYLLCKINPTHERGLMCPYYEKDESPLGDYRNFLSIVPINPDDPDNIFLSNGDRR